MISLPPKMMIRYAAIIAVVSVKVDKGVSPATNLKSFAE